MFTQEQLKEAWEQIQQQQVNADNNAEKALDWIKSQCGFTEDCSCKLDKPYGSEYFRSYEPCPSYLVFIHETYGPHLYNYTDVLDKMSWAKKTDTPVGYYRENPAYEVTTPYGIFTLTFEYFNNHCTGY